MPNAAVGSPLARTTLAYLQARIASGEWPVDSRIPTEPELMELIGVGRTTVREAVRSLASLGMLETLVSRGTYVRSRMPVSSVLADFIAHQRVQDLLGTRRALEVEGARLAALHATEEQVEALARAHAAAGPDGSSAPASPVVTAGSRGTGGTGGTGLVERGRTPGQFHALVLEASGNVLLAELYAGTVVGLRSAVDRGTLVPGTDADRRRADHQEVLDAIVRRDPEGAAAAMSAHAEQDLVLAAPRKQG
ncbi:MAG TPA: FCD domain-containing protein [Cellulomonas sp.]